MMNLRLVVISIIAICGMFAVNYDAEAGVIRLNSRAGDNCAVNTGTFPLSLLPNCGPGGEAGVSAYVIDNYLADIFLAAIVLGGVNTFRVFVNQYLQNCVFNRFTVDHVVSVTLPSSIVDVEVITLQSTEDICFQGCI